MVGKPPCALKARRRKQQHDIRHVKSGWVVDFHGESNETVQCTIVAEIAADEGNLLDVIDQHGTECKVSLNQVSFPVATIKAHETAN
jgi:hypothetical protein